MIQSQFISKTKQTTETFGEFVFEPLTQSFGETMGNALRRTLLSSLEGTAITSVKIDGVTHLFSSIKGVKETALEIVLKLKQIKFKKAGEGVHVIRLEQKGIGKVSAAMFEGDVEIITKDLEIAEITDPKGKLSIEATVESGVGYVDADEQEKKEFGYIAIDSSFSPVQRVNFKVEEARVGRKTNYDRLVLSVWTDGSIGPVEAIRQASEVLSGHFTHIFSTQEETVKTEEQTSSVTQPQEIDKKFHDLIIDELNLPSRVVNALLRENIETVADLIKTGEDKVVSYKGLGRKSVDLIKDELRKLGFEWK